MELWMTSETQRDIATPLRINSNFVEDAINERIKPKNYDLELDAWDCIIILMDGDPNYAEIIKYSKKKRDMDFRLQIDYAAFCKADDLGRQRLIYQMLERSLDLLLEKGLSKTGIESLRADVRMVAKKTSLD